MSDDTPTGEPEPTPSPAEGSVEPTPAPEPVDATADATAAEPVGAEPATAEPVTADASGDPTAIPAATAAAPPPERRNGILVPTWAAIVVAILLIGGLGFAIGYWTADDDGADTANASSSQLAPNRGGSNDNRGGESGGSTPNGNGNGPNAAQIAFLGVELESAANDGGARISSVRPSSPAADAGLKSGDVVTKIDDTTIADDDDLIRAVRAHQPGDEVTVTYTRDGNTAQAMVTLGDRSDATRSSVSP